MDWVIAILGILLGAAAVGLFILWIHYKALSHEIVGLAESLNLKRINIALEDSQQEALVDKAMPYVRQMEEEKHSGEWKFCQAYTKLTRDMTHDKWKAGLAIHQALARLRKG